MDQEAAEAPLWRAILRISFFARRSALCVMYMIASLAVLPYICIAQSLHESSSRPQLVVGMSALSNASNANIYAYDGSVECGIFQTGHGGVPLRPPELHAGVQLPLFGSSWCVMPLIEYQTLPTSYSFFVGPSNSTFEALTPSGQHVRVGRTRSFADTLSSLAIGIDLSYSLLPSLRISVGPRIGTWLNQVYQETEHIDFPDTAYYPENGRRTRTIRGGNLTSSALMASIAVGLSYDFHIPGSVLLRPAFNAAYTPITTTEPASSWQIYSFGGSVSLVIPLGSEQVPEEELPVPVKPTPVPPIAETTEPVKQPSSPTTEATPRPPLELSIKAFGVTDDNNEIPEPTLTVEQVHVQEVFPTLSLILFDDGSSEISPRYEQLTSQSAQRFKQADLYAANALEIQHHVMDIVGERLLNHPDWTITLTGTKSEHSPGDSRANTDFAMARAQSVANYLNSTWGIAYTRIKLKAKSLPDAPSDDLNPSGQAENRRVEIIPTKGDVTAPLWAERIEKVATPPKIHFESGIMTSAGVRSAKIIVRQGSKELQTIDALSEGPSGEYLWRLDDKSMPNYRGTSDGVDSLTYTFEVEDTLGHRSSAEGVIHLHQVRRETVQHAIDTNAAGREIERFSLILFNYSSAQLERKESERILGDVVKSLSAGGRVTMTGHTDKTGDDEFNERLARDRVVKTSQVLTNLLKAQRKDLPSMTVESHGSRDILFDNTLPEGRMLSRTVRIVVEHDSVSRKVQH